LDKINKNIDNKIVAINISVKTVTTLSSYFMRCGRKREFFVGMLRCRYLRRIHVVRPASGPRSDHSFRNNLHQKKKLYTKTMITFRRRPQNALTHPPTTQPEVE
jgi:hypothetical protein